MSAPGTGRWLAIAATVAVAAAVAAAIATMGGPASQRQAKLDARRVDDLARIVRDVRAHFESQDRLPPDLAAVANQPGRRLPRDPGTGSAYEYATTGADRFRVCAIFSTDTAKTPEGAEGWRDADWSHGAGRQCFERKAKE